jgi:DNA invertase Pin-like site-specific DNA recombinase
MPRYGYIRLDKRDADVARQASQLDSIGGFDKIFVEQPARNQSIRFVPEQLNKVIALLQSGDLLYVASLDRFCSQIREFVDRVDQIRTKGADFISLDESFDTRSSSSKTAMKMIRSLEFIERQTMSQRKKEGIRAARDEGRRIGRPPISIPVGFREICKEWERGGISGVEAIQRSKMKSTSFYKKAAELGYSRKK